MSESNILGPARNRFYGRARGSGGAKYYVEFTVPNCAYGWTVESNIAKGKILSIDMKTAQDAPGVLAVVTHQNAPKPKETKPKKDRTQSHGIRNEERLPFADDAIHYAGQYVAVVVAKTIEQARYAASLVRVSYAPEKPLLTFKPGDKNGKKPKENFGEV